MHPTKASCPQAFIHYSKKPIHPHKSKVLIWVFVINRLSKKTKWITCAIQEDKRIETVTNSENRDCPHIHRLNNYYMFF